MNAESEGFGNLNRRALLYQLYFGICAGMGVMTAGAWLSWPSLANRLLLEGKRCCKVTQYQVSLMVALLDFGNIITPIPSSYFMDWVGRKPTLYSTAALYIAGSILVWIANSIWYIYVARLCFGLAKGIAFAVIPIYSAEVADVKIRGALSTMLIGFLNTGVTYDYIFSAAMGDDAYEALHIANLVLPVIFCVGFFFVPESPYYYSMKENEHEAIEALSHFRQLDVGTNELKEEVHVMVLHVKEDLEHKGRYFDLLATRATRRATLIISLLALFQRGSGITPTIAFMTSTLPIHGGGFSREVYMIIFSSILVVATYLVSPLVDTWGRKKLLILSTASTAATQFTSGIYYFFENHKYDMSSWQWLPYACLILFAIAYSLGIGFIPSTLVGELFPINIKCYASSVSAIILAATSFLMNSLFKLISHAWGTEFMYLIFTVTQVACLVFVIFFVFETRGKTFPEIQNILKEI